MQVIVHVSHKRGKLCDDFNPADCVVKAILHNIKTGIVNDSAYAHNFFGHVHCTLYIGIAVSRKASLSTYMYLCTYMSNLDLELECESITA